jgi:hypothetical protein
MKVRELSHSSGSKLYAGRNKFILPVFLVLASLIVWFILRLILWLEVGATELTFKESLAAFILGTWFDTWTLAYQPFSRCVCSCQQPFSRKPGWPFAALGHCLGCSCRPAVRGCV